MKDTKEKITFEIAKQRKIDRELEIDKIIKSLPKDQSRKSYTEKRKIALKQLNLQESLDLQNSTIIIFNIGKIRKARENSIEKKILEIPDTNLNYEEKLFKVLNDLNSSESYEIEVKEEENKDESMEKSAELSKTKDTTKEEMKSVDHSVDQSKSGISESTMDSSMQKSYIETPNKAEQFWIKNKYYDKAINVKANLKKKYIKELEKEYCVFFYDDNFRTYNFAISQCFCELLSYKIPKIEIMNDQYKEEYGLCFCGREINEYNKKCSPNEMMCDECMKKNKEIYELSKNNFAKHILININGRVCINNLEDKKYHCLGKFSKGKETKCCVPGEFSCKACQSLDKIKTYYGNK